MKTRVTFNDFIDTFRKMGRENSFSYMGYRALFDYLEEYEESTGEEIEFDPIGLDCEYIEYANLEEFHEDYNKEEYPDIDTIEEFTQVIMVDDESFIIACF